MEQNKILKEEEPKWMSMFEVILMQELYNAEHNDWVRKNGHCGGNPNCIICNSMMKPTSIVFTDKPIKKEYLYKLKGKEYTEEEFKSLIKGE